MTKREARCPRAALVGLAALAALAFTGCERKPAADDTAKSETVAPPSSEGEPADEGGSAGAAAAADPGESAPAAEPEPTDGIDWAAALNDPALATATAPETFKIELTTTKGPVVLELHRAWSPNGVDRFYNLVKTGYLKDIAIFRAVPGFVAQFGMHGDPAINAKWADANIKDDPVKESNVRGSIVFAMAGPDTRSTQFFINTADNKRLDAMGFSPLGTVVEGMDVVDSWYTGYGDGPPNGTGPDQSLIHERGNDYLRAQFPKLDYIESSRVIP